MAENGMTKAKALNTLRAVREALQRSTNRATISEIIKDLDNDEISIGQAVSRAMDALREPADSRDENLEEALDILREAVRGASRESASEVGRSQEAMDIRDKKNEIAELEARKQRVRDKALVHASKDSGLSESEKLTLENEALKKEAEIDKLIASKKLELAEIKMKKENDRMGDNSIVLQAGRVKMNKDETLHTYSHALAKVLMAEKGCVKKLTDAENEILVKAGLSDKVKEFSKGKITCAAVDQPKFEFDTVTSTSEIFIPATESVLGQNNAGLFINELVYTALEIKPVRSPFGDKTEKIRFAGTFKRPTSEGSSGADTLAEYDCIDPEAIKFGYMEIFPITIAKYLRVTFEVEKMTPASFINWLLQEIRNETERLVAHMRFYGKGIEHTRTEKGGTVTRKRPQFYGVAYQDASGKNVSSIKKTIGTGGDYPRVLDVMLNAPIDLYKKNPQALDGAVYTMSMLAFNELRSTKDSNGDMMFDIIRPISQFGQDPINYPIEMDPNLIGTEVIFGNPRNYKELIASDTEILTDRNIRCRFNELVAYTMRGGVGLKDSFIYATDGGERPDVPTDIAEFRTKINYRGKNA